jgi:two-component system, chemotaxis family, protein-glutamate methylesterase/glutaminase
MIKVLVVDDSAFMRNTISRMITKDQDIQVVGTATNGKEAVEKVELLKPDVMTLDVEMPVMNGIDALKEIMARNPLPVIMMSALTKEGAEITMEALNMGACDFVTKDMSNVSLAIMDKKDELVSKIKDVSRNRTRFLLRRLAMGKKLVSMTPNKQVRHEILSIGASTGGPPALQHILGSLPMDFPVPVVIAQHMPKLFTQSFAQRLDGLSRIKVKEAEDKEPLRPGVALIAPGDSHMGLRQRGREIVVDLRSNGNYIYRPSVDLLMSTVALVYGARSVNVILTGMGNDGLAGMKEVKEKAGFIIAQDEETCVVYGMPRAVVNARLADLVLPLDKIPEEIIRIL